MSAIAESAHREVARLAHQGLDLLTFLRRTEEQFRRVVAFNGAACFFTIDPATLMLTGHINDDLAADDERRRAVNFGVATNEYREDDFNKFAMLARQQERAGILSEAAGNLRNSARYRRLIQPFGLEDELRAAFMTDGACWGGVALFHSAEQPPFESPHRQFLQDVSDSVASGIRTGLVLRAIEPPAAPDGPGVILIDKDGRVDAINAMASHWLGELIDPGGPTADVLPEVVYAVAERTRGEATVGGRAHARVPSRTGQWLIVHGSVMGGSRGGSAVIIEPARAPEIASLLLEAYGLSAREQTVTLCVLQGLSTADIAARLFIAPYTVQDHLKAVFNKVDVHSRKELVARIFFAQYFPRMQDQTPVGDLHCFGDERDLAAG